MTDKMEDLRKAKGYEMAQKGLVQTVADGWVVKSQSGEGFYRVSDTFICDCPDSELHNATCKHAYAVRYYLDIEKLKPEGITNERVRLTYKQAWSAYNQAQSAEGELFDNLLSDLLKEIMDPSPHQMRGRPRIALYTALFVAIKKVYSQMSSRRASSLFRKAQIEGLIDVAPHFNVSSKILNRTDMTPILHELIAITAAPLKAVEEDFAVDSSGFSTRSFGAYAEGKYALKRQRRFLKAHICIGVKTNIITAVSITDETGADSPQFGPLVSETAKRGFAIREVSADKAYNSVANFNLVKELGGLAYIPFKKDATGKSGSTSGNSGRLWRKMFHYFLYNQDEFAVHYHKRSNVESTFGAIKKKLGETLKAKNHTAQVNELLCKLIAYNITVVIQEMYELGVAPKFG